MVFRADSKGEFVTETTFRLSIHLDVFGRVLWVHKLQQELDEGLGHITYDANTHK